MNNHTIYENPLISRYAPKEMLYIFSDDYKFSSWRKLWVVLAEEEKALGLNISDEQIEEMKENILPIDYEYAAVKEKELRHDVMAHIHTFAKQAPKAAPIIHLGATSAFVGDNTDLLQIREALKLTREKLYNVIDALSQKALQTKAIPTLAFTHFQPAQPTTVGKRLCLWAQDLLDDFYLIDTTLSNMRFRGVKGTTGTQASFLELFEGDGEKVDKLNEALTRRFDFNKYYTVGGQTYPRRFDSEVGKILSLLAEDAHKIATDIRLLQSMKEVEEPFEKSQVGSSAMAYKRNPMRSERVCSLARFVMSLSHSVEFTSATQWFERTLDDSANKRLSIPQMFLGISSILDIFLNVFRGLVINEKVIEKNLLRELPFMATENILMRAVQKGGDRQKLHEKIRELSHKCSYEIKQEGLENNLLTYLEEDKDFSLTKEDIASIVSPKKFIGRAETQVEQFVGNDIKKMLDDYKNLASEKGGELIV